VNQAELTTYTADFSRLARTTQLVREGGIWAFLLHLGASEEMPEHKVKGPITFNACRAPSFSARQKKSWNSSQAHSSACPAVNRIVSWPVAPA